MSNTELLKHQYKLIKSSREVVFKYCETISPEHYTRAVDGFGRRTICITETHIGKTYIF